MRSVVAALLTLAMVGAACGDSEKVDDPAFYDLAPNPLVLEVGQSGSVTAAPRSEGVNAFRGTYSVGTVDPCCDAAPRAFGVDVTCNQPVEAATLTVTLIGEFDRGTAERSVTVTCLAPGAVATTTTSAATTTTSAATTTAAATTTSQATTTTLSDDPADAAEERAGAVQAAVPELQSQVSALPAATPLGGIVEKCADSGRTFDVASAGDIPGRLVTVTDPASGDLVSLVHIWSFADDVRASDAFRFAVQIPTNESCAGAQLAAFFGGEPGTSEPITLPPLLAASRVTITAGAQDLVVDFGGAPDGQLVVVAVFIDEPASQQAILSAAVPGE